MFHRSCSDVFLGHGLWRMQTCGTSIHRVSRWAWFCAPRRLALVLPAQNAGLIWGLLICGVVILNGCASVAPQRSGLPPAQTSAQTQAQTQAQTPAPSSASARAAEALVIEQQWLQDWFRGTPVLIAQRSDGTLAVHVPREFCFDAGRSNIKPALSAVLDKVAQSLHRRPTARLTMLAGPADPADAAAPAALGLQRATRMQRHLRERGIALARLAEPLSEGSTGVQLRIAMSP